jgi:hypothetical protein
MIVVEQKQHFMMVKQHDHAKVSGEMALHWKEEYFFDLEKQEELVLAITEHDRGWMELDENPLWNEKEHRPYSFIDYPIGQKLACYKKGIDETENMSLYASLLCSQHYSSFLLDASDSESKVFLIHERNRQEKLFKDLKLERSKEKVEFDLNVLKFCDNLSLYICLHEPGVEKENKFSFFRRGIPQRFDFANYHPIQANWVGLKTVGLSTSPFMDGLEVSLPYKTVAKDMINEVGLQMAYEKAPISIRHVHFIQA